MFNSIFLSYLPSPPYQDNPVLHLYAGLLCLYLAQPVPADGSTHLSRRTLRDAEHYLQRTRQLDPENTIASAWLDSVRLFSSLLSSSMVILISIVYSVRHYI